MQPEERWTHGAYWSRGLNVATNHDEIEFRKRACSIWRGGAARAGSLGAACPVIIDKEVFSASSESC